MGKKLSKRISLPAAAAAEGEITGENEGASGWTDGGPLHQWYVATLSNCLSIHRLSCVLPRLSVSRSVGRSVDGCRRPPACPLARLDA